MTASVEGVLNRGERTERGFGQSALSIISSWPAWAMVVVLAAVALGIGSVHPNQPEHRGTDSPSREHHQVPELYRPLHSPVGCSHLGRAPQRGGDLGSRWSERRQVEQLVVARFGEQALLVPSGSGVDVLLWALPVAVLFVAGLLVGSLSLEKKAARGRAMTLRPSISSGSPGQASKAHGAEALAGERGFLVQSIEDLDEEHARGEVDEVDFGLLQSRYRDRLMEVEEALANCRPKARSSLTRTRASMISRPRARRRRRWPASRRARLMTGIAAAGCFVIAAGLLAASLAGVRLPGSQRRVLCLCPRPNKNNRPSIGLRSSVARARRLKQSSSTTRFCGPTRTNRTLSPMAAGWFAWPDFPRRTSSWSQRATPRSPEPSRSRLAIPTPTRFWVSSCTKTFKGPGQQPPSSATQFLPGHRKAFSSRSSQLPPRPSPRPNKRCRRPMSRPLEQSPSGTG